MAKRSTRRVPTSPAPTPSPATGPDTLPPAAGDGPAAAAGSPGPVSAGTLRNRVVERRRVLGSELVPNQKNFREHPPEQTAALKAVLDELGQTGELLAYYSHRNGGRLTLIDGHKRSTDFPAELWDVAITDLSDAEADKLLVVYDALTAMATQDPVQLNALCASIADTQTAELKALIDSIGAEAADMSFQDVKEGDEGKGGSKGRGDSVGDHKNFRVRPVLAVSQVQVFEEAILATGNMCRGEAIIEICEAYLGRSKG